MIYDPSRLIKVSIQEAEPLFDEEGFNENAILVEINPEICEESGYYLIDKEWYKNYVNLSE